MAHDIFVSYSSEDKPIADTIVAALEKKHIRCWYAPRDITPGAVWGDEIVEAISASEIFLIVFSGFANKSQHVLDELNLAITKETTVLPFRVEKLEPRGAMQLHLATRHWLDAFSPSWEKHIDNLVSTAASYLNVGKKAEAEEQENPVPVADKPEKEIENKPQAAPVPVIEKKKKRTQKKPSGEGGISQERISKEPPSTPKAGAPRKINPKILIGGVIAIAVILAAVLGLPKLLQKEPEVIEPTPTKVLPTTTVYVPEPSIFPGEVPEPVRTLADSDASWRASEHRVLSGDNFLKNLYERPFTSVEMEYQAYLDIFSVDFAYDDDFFYFTINLNGVDESTGGLPGTYAIEFDRTLTGRGDLIVYAKDAGADWSYEDVVVFTDNNADVGGIEPIEAEADFEGSGYDLEVVIDGEKAAFARVIHPENDEQDEEEKLDAIQLAVSRVLLDDPEEFLWGAWADGGLKDFSKFDYNDGMTVEEAGSPFSDSEDYPIEALYSLDNTCRLPYGFEQSGSFYPGICLNVPPPQKPGKEGCTLTCGSGFYLIDCTCVPKPS